MPSQFSMFKLGLAARLAITAALYALGVALQIALHSFLGFWIGVACIVVGWLPLAMGAISNKPDDQGFENWRAVTMAEVDRLADNIAQSQKALRLSMSPVEGLMIGVWLFGSIAGIIAGFMNENQAVYYAFGDLLFMGMPAAIFGNVTVFIPTQLEMKLRCFQALTATSLPLSLQLVPYLRFDKDNAGGEIPEDIRMMMEPKRKPKDLVGAQFQVVINDGPNGAVPYMYAVVITNGKDGPSYLRASGLNSGGFLVEPGGDGDYGSVVLRQATEGGGYHTRPDDCARLRDTVIEILQA